MEGVKFDTDSLRRLRMFSSRHEALAYFFTASCHKRPLTHRPGIWSKERSLEVGVGVIRDSQLQTGRLSYNVV